MKCLHSFCKHCLEQHAKRSDVGDAQGWECPPCKQFTALSDVTACFRTEQLLVLYERVTKPKMCFQCETESAQWKCNDCDDFYCQLCKDLHDRIKKFQGHVFTSVKELTENLVVDTPIRCSIHTAEHVEYYCFECKMLLCTKCAIYDHDGHKRDSVENSVSHVVSDVNKTEAQIHEIAQERFLRSERLKDTRLLVQTFADSSHEALKTQHEDLKRKLNETFESLSKRLRNSVDAELENVNTAIASEDAKHAQANSVMSYVEATLATSGPACAIHESLTNLMPKMSSFYRDVNVIEPITVPNIHYVRKSDANFDPTKLFGTINSSAADFHSRYLPSLCKEKLESAKIGKAIEIDLKRKASCCRFNVGREKIVVCFWDICLLMTYDAVAGSVHKEMDMSGKVKQPVSAAFLSDGEIAVACKDGLVVVDIETASVAQRINTDHVTDVF